MTDTFTALLHDATIAPCPLHQPAEVARAEAEAELEQRRSIVEELRVDNELDRRRKAHEERDQAEAERIAAIEDPLERTLTLITTKSSRTLNAPLSSYPSLAGFEPDDAA